MTWIVVFFLCFYDGTHRRFLNARFAKTIKPAEKKKEKEGKKEKKRKFSTERGEVSR